jgi:hypothetical protein
MPGVRPCPGAAGREKPPAVGPVSRREIRNQPTHLLKPSEILECRKGPKNGSFCVWFQVAKNPTKRLICRPCGTLEFGP